jgi:hypothetical protein
VAGSPEVQVWSLGPEINNGADERSENGNAVEARMEVLLMDIDNVPEDTDVLGGWVVAVVGRRSFERRSGRKDRGRVMLDSRMTVEDDDFDNAMKRVVAVTSEDEHENHTNRYSNKIVYAVVEEIDH